MIWLCTWETHTGWRRKAAFHSETKARAFMTKRRALFHVTNWSVEEIPLEPQE